MNKPQETLDSDITHELFILHQLINTSTTNSFIILRIVKSFNALAVQGIGCAKTEKRGETCPKGIAGNGAVCVTTGAGTKTSSHRPWNTACKPGNIIQYKETTFHHDKTLEFNSTLTIIVSVSKNNLSLVIS